MRLALAPINPTVGAIAGNRALIEAAIDDASARKADLVVLPELAVSGYPPRDLLLHDGFVEECQRTADAIGRSRTRGITAVIGTPTRVATGTRVANSLVVYRDNQPVDTYDKRLLPTYDVFDEDRYFEPGDRPAVIDVAGWRVGLAICEDLWKGHDAGFASHYHHQPDPIAQIAPDCRLIVAPSASPYVLGKGHRHRDILKGHAARHRVYVASVNQLGGNDDLIFDGHAVLIGPDGTTIAAGKGFDPAPLVTDTDATRMGEVTDPLIDQPQDAVLFRALTIGLRDYLRKTGFKDALIGLSGGIDSALTAAIAVRALGPAHVTGVAMPGVFSSDHSKDDAYDLARRLDIPCLTIPITPAQDALTASINPAFAALAKHPLGAVSPDLALENLQSRVRGTLMMALSNRTGAILLTTGNKSELAVGYCTLYGDMNGGLALLSDLPKTLVYRLARWLNDNHAAAGFDRPPIPQRTIDKPPSAELAPDQLDSDSLPPYDLLDDIIERYIERRHAPDRITRDTGHDPATVARICRLIDRNEYKRRQLATGLKVTTVAFGPGRRMPIARG